MSSEQVTAPPPMIDGSSLQAIEAEGAKATSDLARTIVRETVGNNGKVDLARLDRVGPAVRKEVLKLLAETAASVPLTPVVAPQQKRTEAATTMPPQKRPAAAAKKRAVSITPTTASQPQTKRRATTEWRDRCCDARSFTTDAYRHGLGVAAIIGVACMAVLLIFKL